MSESNNIKVNEQGYIELNINGLGFKPVKNQNGEYIKMEEIKEK